MKTETKMKVQNDKVTITFETSLGDGEAALAAVIQFLKNNTDDWFGYTDTIKGVVGDGMTVIDWGSKEQKEKLYQYIKAQATDLAKVGTIENLKEEAVFLAGIITFYEALGKQGEIPSYVIRPGFCHDSAFNLDYYDREHPLRHCKNCGEKMYQRHVIDPDEITRKVRRDRQKGKHVWTCPECHKDYDKETDFEFPQYRKR